MGYNTPAGETAILVVDDDRTSRLILTRILEKAGYRVLSAGNGEDALVIAASEHPDLVLLDIVMPGLDGYEICERLRADATLENLAIIFLSSLDETRDKVRGLNLGAVDFITKPFDPSEVLARVATHATVQSLRRTLEERNRDLERELAVAQELLADMRRRVEGPLKGESRPLRRLREDIANAASHLNPVLLSGPRGAGEETVARAIHVESARALRPFLRVSGAVSASEGDAIFGRRGDARRSSTYDLAAGGTLYIDGLQNLEVGLQRRLAARLAEAAPPSQRPRIIAYSAQPLGQLSAEASFDEELLRALAGEHITIPGLAERLEDLPQLTRHYAEACGQRLGQPFETVTPGSLERLRSYHWPGNLRELEALVERAMMLSPGPVLEVDASLLEGDRSLGSYKLLRKLGGGGMGEVWLGEHRLLARPAAVKRIKPDALPNDEADREEVIQRFRREAIATAKLESPHTVKLYDFGVDRSGALYYVMESLRGLDLETMVKRAGPLPPERVVYLLRQACRSLAEAHDAGLVHRDIKPSNLFACILGMEFDVVKVLDFGVVKGQIGPPELSVTTQDRGVPGTPTYMAPEMAQGRSDLDGRSDIYSLGCVAFTLLTGEIYFAGRDVTETLMNQIVKPPAAPSALAPVPIPPQLDEIVLRCLEKSRAARIASALELDRALAAVPFEEPWTNIHAAKWWRDRIDAEAEEAAQAGDDSTRVSSSDELPRP